MVRSVCAVCSLSICVRLASAAGHIDTALGKSKSFVLRSSALIWSSLIPTTILSFIKLSQLVSVFA
uniref:Secreted protein n=1 Tax=Anguilla anguilla TaxID=7936 RepID=A0A0E9PSG3_ANGAN